MGKLKEKWNNWLDEKPGRRQNVSYGLFLTGCFCTGFAIGGIVDLIRDLSAAKSEANVTEALTDVDKNVIWHFSGTGDLKDLPKPEMNKGVLDSIWQEAGLTHAIVGSGEFEFLDDRTLRVKDLGEFGKAFVNAEGTLIQEDTPINLIMEFQDRA